MRSDATAEAPANLAFVKYWGKKDVNLRIPSNNSISVNLSNALTTTSVSFDPVITNDQLQVAGKTVPPESDFYMRVTQHIDRIRKMSGIDDRAFISTKNSFPEAVGIASSASGFAALTLAASSAAGLELNQKELSALSRLGSGSACRSIPDGFTEWIASDNHGKSYAIQIASPSHWDIRIISVIVSKKSKKLSSTEGHNLASVSPFFRARLETLPERLKLVREAILVKDFKTFGQQTELEAISFHTIAMTSPFLANDHWVSGGYYWLPESMEIILAVQAWRKKGINVYFSMDAGPTMHLICLKEELDLVQKQLQEVESRIPGRRWDVLVNSPAPGARLVPYQHNVDEGIA